MRYGNLLFRFSVTGGELFNKIVTKGFYSESDGAFLIKQILDGIAFMHSKNLVHRDLKVRYTNRLICKIIFNALFAHLTLGFTMQPENLLCASPADDLSDVKLSDFGLAKEVPPGTTLSGRYGSPQYMAYEILDYMQLTLANLISTTALKFGPRSLTD